jgi:hypothetical protein
MEILISQIKKYAMKKIYSLYLFVKKQNINGISIDFRLKIAGISSRDRFHLLRDGFHRT